jgi:hypothetical protein
MNHHATGVAQTEMAIVEAWIAALKDMAELMREQLDDVRQDRDAWRGQAEANQRLQRVLEPLVACSGGAQSVNPTI